MEDARVAGDGNEGRRVRWRGVSEELRGVVELVERRTLTSAGRRESSSTDFEMKGEGLAVVRKRIRPRMKTISGVGGVGC